MTIPGQTLAIMLLVMTAAARTGTVETTSQHSATSPRVPEGRSHPSRSASTSVAQTPVSPLGGRLWRCLKSANVTLTLTHDLTCWAWLPVQRALLNWMTHHVAASTCQEPEVYDDVIECLLNATEVCPPPVQLHRPEEHKVKAGMRYLCQLSNSHRFDVNIQCASAHMPNILHCVHNDMRLLDDTYTIRGPSDPDAVCRALHVTSLCCWETLQVCGRDTAGAFTRLLAHYLSSSVCLNRGAHTSTPGLLLLFAILASITS